MQLRHIKDKNPAYYADFVDNYVRQKLNLKETAADVFSKVTRNNMSIRLMAWRDKMRFTEQPTILNHKYFYKTILTIHTVYTILNINLNSHLESQPELYC